MKNQRIILLASSMLGTLILLYIIFQAANIQNRRANGFSRIHLDTKLEMINSYRLTEPLTGIAGWDKSGFYFTVDNPQWLIKLDTTFSTKDTVYIGPLHTAAIEGMYNTYVDYPFHYILNNNGPSIYRGRFKSYLLDSIKIKSNIFMRSVYIPPNNALISVLDDSYTKQKIYKIKLSDGNIIDSFDLKTIDADKIETESFMEYDNQGKNIVLIEYYRNKIYSLDSNLKLNYISQTIDTTTTTENKFNTVKKKDESSITPSRPRIQVNEKACVDNGVIYIKSGLRSDNEEKKKFRENSVIDMYGVKDGKYKGSFYIPNIEEDKLITFIVRKNRIICLYKKYAVYFSILHN